MKALQLVVRAAVENVYDSFEYQKELLLCERWKLQAAHVYALCAGALFEGFAVFDNFFMHAMAVVEARGGCPGQMAQTDMQQLEGAFEPSLLERETVLVDKAVVGELALGHAGIFYHKAPRQHCHEHALVEFV